MRVQILHTLVLMLFAAFLFSAFFSGVLLSSSHLAYDLNRLFLVALLVVGVLVFAFISKGIIYEGLIRQVSGYSIIVVSATASNSINFVDDYRVLDTLYILSFFLFVLVAGIFVPSSKTISLFRFVFWIFLIFFSILILLIFSFWVFEYGQNGLRSLVTSLGFLNINFLGHLISVSLPLVVFFVLSSYSGGFIFRAIFLFFVLIFSWFLLFELSIKGSVLGLFGSCFILFLLFRSRVRWYLNLFFASFLSAVALYMLHKFFDVSP